MVQDVFDQTVAEKLDSIAQRISDPTVGAYVSISPNAASLGALKQLLEEKIKKDSENFNKNLNNALKDKDKKEKERHKELVDTLGDQDKEIKEAKKYNLRHYKTLESLAEAIRDKSDEQGKASLSRGEKAVIWMDIINKSLKLTNKIVKDISNKMTENIKKQFEMIGLIRSSGVSIKEGFDETFNQYADISGMTRDAFSQALSENSKFIASVNATGSDGASLLAKESRKLVGKLGLTSGEIESSFKAYNDSMLTTANAASIATMDHTNQLMKSTSALKMFAMATGQSYENILKEQREKERSWQMQRLATDPRTRAQFMMMRNAGLSDDLIEAIMLGKYNKASTMAMLDPNSARMMNEMRRAYMSTINNPEAFADAMVRLNHSSAAEGMRRSEANTNVMDYAYINGLGELFAPGSTQWGMLTAQHMDFDKNRLLNGTDAKHVNSMQELSASINALKNDIAQALTPSIKTLNNWLDPEGTLVKSIKWLAELIGEHPIATLMTYGALTIGKNIASSFLGYMLQAKAFQMMGLGIGSTAAKEITKTTLWSKVGAILTSKMMWAKVGGVLGGVVGAVAGSSIGGYLAEKYTNGGVSGALVGGVSGGLSGAGIGAIIGGIGGFIIGGPPGALLGAKAGAWIGGIGGGIGGGVNGYNAKSKELNEPASAPEYSEYNPSNQSSSNNQPEVVTTQHNVISLNGMDSLKSLLRDINSNTKAVVTELRNSGFKTGSNLAT